MASVKHELLTQKLEAMALPILQEAGVDLIELKVKGLISDLSIQVMADKPEGGITIEECSILNKALVHAIEAQALIPPEHFSLEFSSSGLDRPLSTMKDFLRVRNYDLHFWLKDAVEGKKEIEGLLTKVNESSLTIVTSKKKEIVLPLNIIIKGMLVF